MTEGAGYASGSVTWLLVLFGLGMVAGNLLGRFADRALMPMLYVTLSAPPLQKRVLDTADAPTLAPAVNIGASNLGNPLAAWLGGLIRAVGFGPASPNIVGAVLAGIAPGLAVLSAFLERRSGTKRSRTLADRPGGPVVNGTAGTDRTDKESEPAVAAGH